jgi:hydroxymethylbilane synthase
VTVLRLGTRGSPLARVQARTVAAQVAARGGPHCEIVIIRTSGDQITDRPLSEAGGKRLFVREIEEALLAGAVDLAVHSSKDLPAELPAGLAIGAVLPREDPTDALVLPGAASGGFEDLVGRLAPRARIGTGSVRRIAQLRGRLPEARFDLIRGNIDTRLRKLDRGDYDGVVLASAGLRRLNLGGRISAAIPVDVCVPAPGQGIIAVEIRADDDRARAALAGVDDPATSAALEAERALVVALGGGCQMPIGALARPVGDALDMLAIVASLDGAEVVRDRRQGPRQAATALGREVAAALLDRGAAVILAQARDDGTSVADPHGP